MKSPACDSSYISSVDVCGVPVKVTVDVLVPEFETSVPVMVLKSNTISPLDSTVVGDGVGTRVGLDLVSEAEVISTYCIISKSTIRLQDTFKHDFIVIFANTCAY